LRIADCGLVDGTPQSEIRDPNCLGFATIAVMAVGFNEAIFRRFEPPDPALRNGV
jgi:hypothetical protein